MRRELNSTGYATIRHLAAWRGLDQIGVPPQAVAARGVSPPPSTGVDWSGCDLADASFTGVQPGAEGPVDLS